MAAEIILHHYPMSPFAEKARLMLGFKRLAWRSVHIPMVMPKPDVVALTGGYRKTPLLQIGADVYCDTALMAQLLERLQPEPALLPASAPLAPLLAQWADSTLFWTAIGYASLPAGLAAMAGRLTPEQLQAFAADRAPFLATAPRVSPREAGVQLARYLSALQGQLTQAGPWLCGAAPSVADLAVAHNLWYVKGAGTLATIFDPHPAVAEWLARVLAFGHGEFTPMDSSEALAVAAAAGGHAPVAVAPGLGFEAGQTVSIAAIDYGTEASHGVLVGLTADEAVIARDDPRAGRVHVHFPRIGYRIKKEST